MMRTGEAKKYLASESNSMIINSLNNLFILSPICSNYLVGILWVIYFPMYVSSVAHFFYVVAISLSSLGSSEHPSCSSLLESLPFTLISTVKSCYHVCQYCIFADTRFP